MTNALKRLRDVCNGACGLFVTNSKMRVSLAELNGTVGIQIRTRNHIKCKIYFGQEVPEDLIENIFDILLEIDQLTGLELVNVAYISLKIGKLVNLENLGIESKYITTPPAEIRNLKNLVELSLRLEKMEEFPNWILELNELEILDLMGAGIKEIPQEIDCLKNIKVMDLSGTHLKKIPYTILNLELPFKNYFNEIKANGIYFCDATCELPPINVIASGRKLLKMYYNNHTLVPQSEVRVILLGLKGSGKTSIVQRFKELEDGKSYYKKEGWTEGISINNIRCGEEGIFHMWDFGGQEIMLSTHTLFLRDHCIYIIVLNARQGDEPERWLDYISQYGKNSTVFIVDNHMDEADDFRPDINKLRRMYPNLLNWDGKIWGVSCECPEDYPLNGLYEQVCTEAKKYLKKEIPLAWNELSVKLVDMKKKGKKVNYITHEDYSMVCMQCGIKEQEEKEEVLKWLNEIGVVFTYGDSRAIESINEFKVLRPAWVTDAIYKIINNVKTQQDDCLITHNQIRQSLVMGKSENHTGNAYSDLEIHFILEVMRRFGLSFQFSNIDEFIPAVAINEEFFEVVEWIEDRNNTILDMVYQMLPMKSVKYQESNVNLTQFYQVVIKIVEKFKVFPRMWRTGALFSDIEGFNVLLFLQNKGRWNNELRLIIKCNSKNREKAAKFQWNILEYLKEIAKDYTIDAKILLMSSEGEHYFSINKALKIGLNSSNFEYYDSDLDIKINLFDDVISKVVPNAFLFLQESFGRLQNTVREGVHKTEEAIQIIQDMCGLQAKQIDFYKDIGSKIDSQNWQLSQLYLLELYNSQELWSLCSEIQKSGNLQSEEIREIKKKLEELLEKQPGEKGWKEGLINCINSLAAIVTLGTADYGKISGIIELLKALAKNIAN